MATLHYDFVFFSQISPFPQCPTCKKQIHQSYPLNYIAHDRTMQDIVYKLVPHLAEDETERERKFYEERGLPNPKDEKDEDEEEEEEEAEEADSANPEKEGEEEEEAEEEEKKMKTFHREDEQVNICLEPEEDSNLSPVDKKYIRCSSQATINHIKKYVALKVFRDVGRFKEVDIVCNQNICGRDHTLKFVVISNWKCQQYPMQLKYRPKSEYY